MTNKTFDSSVLREATVDGERLELCFKSGARYVFQGVPAEVSQGLLEAESAGEFFNANIKGKFEESLVKRGRGRPKGSKNKPKVSL